MVEFNPSTGEVYLTHTNRPTYVPITQLCTEEGYTRFGVNPQLIDQCVGDLMVVLQRYDADIAMAALGVWTTFILQRFQLDLVKYYRYINKFLQERSLKPKCHAAQRMVGCLWQDHLKRYERVDFKHTRTVKIMPK